MKENEDIIEKDWPENYGRAWVELLESDVSEHARTCYTAMTSFGPGLCRAGQTAILKRMGIKNKDTLRAAQKELVDVGWMELKQAATLTTPNKWKMFQTPKKVCTVGTEGMNQNALGVCTDATVKQEDKHESKKEEPKTAPDKPVKSGKHPDQDAFWKGAQAAWIEKHQGAPLKWPTAMRGFQEKLNEEIQRLGWVELLRRWTNMVQDPWALASFRDFMPNTDKWIKRREAGQTNQRTFFTPPSTEGIRSSGRTVGD